MTNNVMKITLVASSLDLPFLDSASCRHDTELFLNLLIEPPLGSAVQVPMHSGAKETKSVLSVSQQ